MPSFLPSFVTPSLAIAGLALLSVPILIHLLSRRRYRVVDWAAMEFLRRAVRRTRRRMRLEQFLLLFTRCAVILLAALALARPFGCDRSSLAQFAGRRSGLHVLVIDNAMSMSYQSDRPGARTNLDQAKLLAKRLIDRMSTGGESVAIITAAKPARALTAAPIYDLAEARRIIDDIDPSAAPADLPGALARAIDIGRAASGEPARELVLFTDSARGAFAPQADAIAAAARQAAAIFRIVHYNLARPGAWNQAVTELDQGPQIARIGFETDFSATVRGFGPATTAAVQWRIDGQPVAAPQSIRPDVATPPITESHAQFTSGGPHTLAVTLTGNDRLPIDDTRYRIVNVASQLKVLIVEGDRGLTPLSGSGAFLDLALSPPPTTNGARATGYLSVERIGELELPSKLLTEYAAVILADVGEVAGPEADRLADFVKAGGSLLLFMGERVSSDNYNAKLLPRDLLPGPLTHRVGAGQQVAHTFDFRADAVTEPLLQIFAGQPRSGLDTAQVFTYWQVDPRAASHARHVLNYVADAAGHRDPAITVQDLGRGHVVFFSTSADAQWTTFPAKPAYVALMHELVSGTIDANDQWMNLQVGQALVVPPGIPITTAPILRDPQRQILPMQAAPSVDQAGRTVYRSELISRPGLYSLFTGLRDWPVAVNIAPEASDIRILDATALHQALGDANVTLLGDELPPASADSDSAANDYGFAILLAVLLLAAAETVLAMRFGRYRTETAPAT